MQQMRDFSLLLVTSRPAVHVFFEHLGQNATPALGVRSVPAVVDTLATHSGPVATATVAVVDAIPDPVYAIQTCEELRTQRPALPVVVLLCCPHSLTPWQLRALISTGVRSLLDLQATAEEVQRVLHSIARGEVALHVRLTNGHGAWLEDITAGQELSGETGSERSPTRTSPQILELLVHGQSDQEIGKQLHLSPHTIRHHINRLRSEVGARNRTELAAWAGRQGFYRASAKKPTEVA